MEIFPEKEWVTLCEREREQNKRLGKGAKKLRARLEELRAATNVSELFAGRPHPLKGDRTGQFALDLDGARRLVFEPASNPSPRREDGSIAWEQVTAVRIVFIGDYHD